MGKKKGKLVFTNGFLTHLFVWSAVVQYEVVGEVGPVGEDGLLLVWFGPGHVGGSVGDDDLLQQPLPQRPQVGGTVGHGTLGTGCIVYS